ncbi:MAG: response regulator [Zetaproteobacteria bacterium CG12_big_fil_rev_8_21_14_0_65_54_13]|nr:MAG: response regulator [Zetaproteobacteria bacterium CG23_combo_of_CG06-09_8_20_14_all_54_7]PIW50266.1 MAG: response regulator [Zetaproteobacteria bacterium CG12_big_fil_rev_8_21_14_0_65_54_13]PIX54761.1 MAG: response regulator [Zetaproteobacteria bacterium CG_4_10_14_3_um_filter_54_28]PJA29683.1 MAG: response regulator [Zetaproteobacteria bacterium CG_4_9_14_3_um_filter_54_145]
MSLLSGKKIAVLDDNDTILMLFSALLEAHGAQVTTDTTGEPFLARMADALPDLILLDIQMPDMDGYQVLAQLKAMAIEIPVIALTAHAMGGDREKILERGFTGYIAKPVDTRSFPEQVAAALLHT